MKETEFRDRLNDEQFAAATAPDGPLLVLAAAGTAIVIISPFLKALSFGCRALGFSAGT